MIKLLLIGGFGAAGALARYGLDSWVSDATQGQFPWGTLTVNVLGAFLLGLLIPFTTDRLLLDEEVRIGITIGLLGSFTTFSTFTYESIRLAEDSAWLLAFANVFAMVVIGLLAGVAGLVVGRTL